MKGAYVTYYLDDGKSVGVGGSFDDVEHVFEHRLEIERRYNARVIGHIAKWKR